jgi:hypothetical protein
LKSAFNAQPFAAFMRRSHLLSATAALMALLAMGGCRKPEITTYTAPKDVAPTMPGLPAATPSNTSGQPGASSAAAIRWRLPTGWQDQGANNIRLGNILVTDAQGQRAEMTVTRFEGDVGGDLANVNRWRGQLQLAPIDDAALSQAIIHRDYPSGHMDIVEFASDAPIAGAPQKTRMMVAWLKKPDATWFFKLTGADPLVAAQRDAFDAFLRSVEFSHSAPATASNPTPQLPDGHPPISSGSVSASPAQNTPAAPTPGTTANSPAPVGPAAPPMSMAGATLPATAVTSSNALLWTAPADWTEKPLGPVRKGSFAVRGADGAEADLSITAFPGDVGGLLANINRWRGELQLPPLAEAELSANTTTVTARGSDSLRFTVVDFAGSPGSTPTRTLGAIVPVGSDTYFFKFKGPDAVVAAQKNAFLAFLETVKTR